MPLLLQVNDLQNIDDLVERLMELPRSFHERITKNTEMIQTLNLQTERLVKLICGLHDIDVEALRKEFQIPE